jgi:F5/8 type C domain-containing protein
VLLPCKRFVVKPVKRGRWNPLCVCSIFAALSIYPYVAVAQGSDVLTRSYNNQRTGANLSETILNSSNVRPSRFGKLFMLDVDDEVYAGILYVSNLQIAGGSHNVIYVATTNNTVYAFDADTYGPPLWSRNFNGNGRPLRNTDVGKGCAADGYHDYARTIGIVGTPVIDGVTSTMYFVTRVIEAKTIVQRLWAIDIVTGLDRLNSPQVVRAKLGTVVFNSATANQRAGLALSQGTVYVAWASYCDVGHFHGWVLAYNASSLAQVGAFNSTPNGEEGGIWMAGAGPALDTSGNLYLATGNGDWDGVTSFGDSLLKLAPVSLRILDYFTPSTHQTLRANDLDFGSAGPTLLPDTDLLVQGGKTGVVYLLNTRDLGHEKSGDVQIPQVFQAVNTAAAPTLPHYIHNANPVWKSPKGLNLYVWGANDFLRSYRFNESGGTFQTTPVATGSVLPPIGMTGALLAVSANAAQAGTGVVWASAPRSGDASHSSVPANLYAFNAENLALLWSSTGQGDDLLNFSKGSPPVVANGKVYVGSISRFVSAYGPRNSTVPPQNLALHKIASSSTPCDPSQTAAQAVNGSYSKGKNDSWCSAVADPWMLVDLGASYDIKRFVIEHAGAGGEGFNSNTADFKIELGSDGVNFSTVVDVKGNVDSITTHDIAPTAARFARLNIVKATQTSDVTARIYEFQVIGTQPDIAADFSIAANPSSRKVKAGVTASYSAAVVAKKGFSGSIRFSVMGLPAGAKVSVQPATLTGSGNCVLNVSTTSSTPAGTYSLSVTGRSGEIQHSTSITLEID